MLVLVGVLVALLVPAVRHARRRALAAHCLAQMSGMARMCAMYAGEHADAWPYYKLPDPWRADLPNHPEPLLREVGLAAGIWYKAMPEYVGSDLLGDPLACRGDFDWHAGILRSAEELGVPVKDVTHTLRRTISEAMYWDPRALDPARPNADRSLFRVTRTHEVLFPSSKALLVESTPVHEPWYRGNPLPFRPENWSVAAVDGSASLRHTDTLLPAANLSRLPPRNEFVVPMIEMSNKLRWTAHGVRGQDW